MRKPCTKDEAIAQAVHRMKSIGMSGRYHIYKDHDGAYSIRRHGPRSLYVPSTYTHVGVVVVTETKFIPAQEINR